MIELSLNSLSIFQTLLLYSYICPSTRDLFLIDLILCNESRLNDDMWRTGHLFFYLADEGKNALSLGRGVVDVHETSILASGSREDVGNWQLHLKSEVCCSTRVAIFIVRRDSHFNQISMM